MTPEEVALKCIKESYLMSGDFNGCGIGAVIKTMQLSEQDAIQVVSRLVELGMVDIASPKFHPNPHIKAFSNIAIDKQIEVMRTSGISDCCLYPSILAMKSTRLGKKYATRPYAKMLAKGYGQLDYISFDLSVLEPYFNDPRYSIDTDGINGNISAREPVVGGDNLGVNDQVFLQAFGYSFDENFRRYVAVYIRYLCDLSPEHQVMWSLKEVKRELQLHPDYYRNSILGCWGGKLSIYDAIFMELKVINQMSMAICGIKLFQNDYEGNRPRDFIFLLRPTLKEFGHFVHRLDKIITENLNKDFFRGAVTLESEAIRKDGKVVVSNKGTIQLLEEWIRKSFQSSDAKPIDRLFVNLKNLRKLRQKPAHKDELNTFNSKFDDEQRVLMRDVYGSIRILRLILANHPDVRVSDIQINDLLFKGEIWPI